MTQAMIPGPSKDEDPSEKWSARGYIRFGVFGVLILVAGVGGWGATAEIAGAVIASGQLRVTAQQQVVQHPDGGVVGEILVADGDRVEGGDVLIRLNGTSLRAELAALEGQLYELMARSGRLEAEQLGAETISFDPELIEVAARDPEVRKLMDGQTALFEARKRTMRREIEILDERKGQIREQITGAEAEIAALKRQSELIQKELADQQRLLDRGLAQASRVLSLQREAARLEGQAGQMMAQNARLKGQISELEIEQIRMEDSRREEAIAELREIGFRQVELVQKRIQIQERLDRLEIRAPRAGIVYDLKVHALKSVVRPADPVMFIVPVDTGLVIETRVATTDRDNVWETQEAAVRFTALPTRTSPELTGYVHRISADKFTDEQSGVEFYKVEVDLPDEEWDKLSEFELSAGMPVEAHIQTVMRTPLEYMVKPITDYIAHAWRETD